MHLIEVAPDKTKMVSGYEQHTFECSGCRDHVRQLVFIPRAIEPLNSEEMRLSAAWLETLNKGPIPKGDDLSCAVRTASPLKTVYAFGMLTLIVVAGSLIIWGQGLKGPVGDQGPPGPKGPQGDAGPPSTTSGIRIVHSACDETTCRVQCSENEMLLTAYCGPQPKPRHHTNRTSRDVPQPRAGEQSTCCGVRAHDVSIASQHPKQSFC